MMKASWVWSCATGAMALALLNSEAVVAQSSEPIAELTTEVDTNASAWTVDRADVTTFINADWQGREDVIKLSVSPPANPVSFYNWQGYSQQLNTPAGAASLKGDLWIGSEWASGTDSDYIRTGIWGSVQPESAQSYVDNLAVFPIISFTNQDGLARLQVWDTTANSEGGWVDLDASESALNLAEWNTFETRVLPGSDRIDYVVNGQVVYTWNMPRGAEDNAADKFWAVYLNARNNGVTSFDSYWSQLEQAQLVLNGEQITAAPTGVNVLAGAQGSLSVADGVTIGGPIHSSSDSNVTVGFGQGSGVSLASGDGVVSDEGGTISLDGGSVTVSDTSGRGLYATGEGSRIVTQGTIVSALGGSASAVVATEGGSVSVSGGSISGGRNGLFASNGQIVAKDAAISGQYGALATDGGTISIEGGTVSSSQMGVFANNGSITTKGTEVSLSVASNNPSDVGAATALGEGTVTVEGGSISVEGARASALFAMAGADISATDVTIKGSGDRVRGAYSHADDSGASSITVSGGDIETAGLLSHGLFAKRESGTTADTVATIDASNLTISADGMSANGVYAGVGGAIEITGSTIATAGEGGAGLHAQAVDHGMVGGGTLSATSTNVTTSGQSALGAYAELGGDLSITGGSVTTSGSQAHALVASGTADHMSRITATDVIVSAQASNSVGGAILGSGTLHVVGGSIHGGAATLAAQTVEGGTASFVVDGASLGSDSGTLLAVDRSGGDGSGVVSLTLSGAANATGNIVDTGEKTTGYADVALNGATLNGSIDGVRRLGLLGGGIWNAAGAGTIGEVNVGTGGGKIATAANTTMSLSGTLSGSGNLTLGGAGTLLLSGNGADYSGIATIDSGLVLLTGSMGGDLVINEAGTFQIGNNDAAGDLTGSTVNNGTLIFARSDDYDYTGALSGDGGLIKRGEGTLLLSGAYSYTGSTIVEGGLVKLASQLDEDTDLVIDNGTFDLSDKTQGVSGLSGTGGVLALGSSGVLTVTQLENTAFGGAITGAGTFIKTGSGSLNLTGESSFSGTVFVGGGRLALNGSMWDAIFTVTDGATLGGNGNFGTVTVELGGAAAPGNSIGTMHVAGDVTFDAGSIYQVEVNSEGANDKIIASGAAKLDGGTVSVLAALGDYARFTDYEILSAEGGVTGTFAGSDVDLPFLDANLQYGAKNVILTLARNDLSFATAANTTNQTAVASALDDLAPTDPLFRAVTGQTTAAAARNAFDALSGELWASIDTLLVDQTRATGEAVLRRTRQADALTGALGANGSNAVTTKGGRTSIWGEGVARWNDLDSGGNAAGVRQNSTGFLTGIDSVVGGWRLGAAFGYTESDADITQRASSATTKSTTVAIYAGGGLGPVRLSFGGAYAWHDVEGERSVVFPSFSEQAKGQYDGRSASVFGELGWAVDMGELRVEPFAGVNYVHLKTDGFTETGAADAGLTVEKDQRDVTYSNLGLRMRANIAVSGSATISPHLSAAWQHGFGDDVEGYRKNSFNGASAFQIAGIPIARNAAAIEAGFDAAFAPGAVVGVSYVGNIAEGWSDNGVKIGMAYRF